jgi:lipooligosaccharide transport system ATP-binding protein
MSSAAPGGLNRGSPTGRPFKMISVHVQSQDHDRATMSRATGSAIRLEGVVKRFGAVTAVDGLDLEVPFGTCIGLLGPNGAGKSTTMKALTAQVIADEGRIEVLGHVLPEDSKQARAEMGVVPQLDNLDVSLTVEQNLLVFAHLYRVPAAARKEAIEHALAIANLGDRRGAKVDELSGGMRRRLLIARALLHRPRLMLLDEPTVGLDPQVRQELWALIDRLRSEGVSILMSTHYIEEAERLCDEVTIMSHGKAVAVGSPRALIAEHAGPEAIEVYGPPARLGEVEAMAQIRGWRTRRTGTSVSILRANGATDIDGERRVTNLEDVFVLLTGEEIS